MSLVEYLSELNTADNQWGLWVNPENINEYRIGQDCFDNGGRVDGWVRVGNLEALSFGSQSESEAFETSVFDNFIEEFPEGIDKDEAWDLVCDATVDSSLLRRVRDDIDIIVECWAKEEASVFVSDQIPEILEEAKRLEAESTKFVDENGVAHEYETAY